MRFGIGLGGALAVVLLLTSASLWRFSGNGSAATAVNPQVSPHMPALLVQETPEGVDPGANGATNGVPNGEWPEGLSVLPEDGSQACPTTPIWASYPAANGASDLVLMLDGVDVTGQSQINPDGTISYQVPTLLSAGLHEASISFPDASGVMGTYTWTFEIAGVACAVPPTVASPVTEPPAAEPPPSAPPPVAAPPATEPSVPGVPPAAPPAASRPALGALPSQGILHIVAEHSWISPAGETRTAVTETWLNLASGEARTTERDPANNTELGSTIRNGQSIIQLIPQERRAMTQVFPDANAPDLNAIRETLLGYRAAYEQNRLPFVGEETIDGMTAVRLSAPPQGESASIDVWLRKDYGLILREIAYRPGAAREVAQTHVVTYRQVEVLPNVPGDTFAPAIPSDWLQVTSRLLTQQQAAALRDYDLYWLGTEHQGFVLAGISEESVTIPAGQAPPGAPTGTQRSIVVGYASAPPAPPSGSQTTPPQPPAPGGVTLIQRPASSVQQPPSSQPGRPGQPGGSSGQPGLPPGAEQVTVNGNRGFVLQLPPPPTPQPAQGQPSGPAPAPPTILELTIGGTQVTIQGRDRAQVMQAAQDLRRLN